MCDYGHIESAVGQNDERAGNGRKKERMKTETGIEVDFTALTETQAPYLTGGTVTLAVGQYQGSYYEGGYADAAGKEYRAIWTEIDAAADDEDAADWARPDYLIES